MKIGPFETGKVYLGDCLDLLCDLPDCSIEAVITDPPYSSGGMFRGDRAATVVNKYVRSSSFNTCRIGFGGDNKDQLSMLVWSCLLFGRLHSVCEDGAVLLVFSDWRQIPLFSNAIQAGGWVWRGLATWWKPGIRMQKGRFSSSAEHILYASKGTPAPGPESPQNVFSSPPISGKNKDHIAEKPESVLRWLLGLTPEGSLVLDPFAGAGTTGAVCVSNNRHFIGFELDKYYVDLANSRLSATMKGLSRDEYRLGQKTLFHEMGGSNE